jgi:hypothetical protein
MMHNTVFIEKKSVSSTSVLLDDLFLAVGINELSKQLAVPLF